MSSDYKICIPLQQTVSEYHIVQIALGGCVMTDKDRVVTIVTATSQEEIDKELEFRELNAKGFVRGVNAQDQWFILVNDAWAATKFPVNETIKAYLVQMLLRFMGRTNLFEQLSIFDYNQFILGTQEFDPEGVQDIADISLQYVAYFPERSRYRHEPRSLEYSSKIGVGLYQWLSEKSEGKDDWFSCAYREMASSFALAVMVLRSVCPRFALKRTVTKELHDSRLRFPTDKQARDIMRGIADFDSMHLKGAMVHSTRKH